MVLGMSLGEIGLILGVGAWALGPKELPRLAKGLGRLTGRATGFVHRARSKATDFASQNDLTQLHQELQATLNQLNTIKTELQTGILNPGPLAQTLIRAGQLANSSAAAAGIPPTPASDTPGSSSSGQQPVGAMHRTADHRYSISDTQQQQQQQQRVEGLLGTTLGNRLGTSPNKRGTFVDTGTPQTRVVVSDDALAELLREYHIPVSAVLAGLAPDRSSSLPSGSEVMADAMHEAAVAAQALRFLEQQQRGGTAGNIGKGDDTEGSDAAK